MNWGPRVSFVSYLSYEHDLFSSKSLLFWAPVYAISVWWAGFIVMGLIGKLIDFFVFARFPGSWNVKIKEFFKRMKPPRFE
jgi:hypothetical protein